MNKSYPILYSRASTGAIQIWQLELEEGRYRCRYGQKDGKIQTGSWTNVIEKNIGKINQTSLNSQAEKEADAEFKKKLSQKGYFENILDIDNKTFFEPQLAKNWDDYKDEINLSAGGWCISSKLDGCLDGNTLIKFKDGRLIKISEVVERKIQGKVLSYNKVKKRKEYKKILNWSKNLESFDNEIVQWYEIETERGDKLKLTGNHLVFLPELSCWRRVDKLKGTEKLLLGEDPSNFGVSSSYGLLNPKNRKADQSKEKRI